MCSRTLPLTKEKRSEGAATRTLSVLLLKKVAKVLIYKQKSGNYDTH